MKLGYMEPVHPLDLPIAPYMYYSPNLVVPIHGELTASVRSRVAATRARPSPAPRRARAPGSGGGAASGIRVRTGAGGRGQRGDGRDVGRRSDGPVADDETSRDVPRPRSVPL